MAAANKAVHDGDLVDEKFLEAKREELDTLAKKAQSRSIAMRTAMLFWIVQHNNHLRRDTRVGTLMGSAGRQLGKTVRSRTLHVRPMRRSGAATNTT